MLAVDARKPALDKAPLFSDDLGALNDTLARLEITDLTTKDLIDLRGQLLALQDQLVRRDDLDSAGLEARLLMQQSLQAIDNLLNPLVLPQDDTFGLARHP